MADGMILERAELLTKRGDEEAFIEMMRQSGCRLLSSAPGCHSMRFGRGVENPSKFILLLDWESIAHHIALTKTEAFAEFRALAGPYLEGPAAMEHFEML